MNWSDFARIAPDFASAGKRLLTPEGSVSIGFLATVFAFDIESSMWGYWENAGRPDTRPVRRVWRAG